MDMKTGTRDERCSLNKPCCSPSQASALLEDNKLSPWLSQQTGGTRLAALITQQTSGHKENVSSNSLAFSVR